MFRHRSAFQPPGHRFCALGLLAVLMLGAAVPANGVLLWSDLGATLVQNNGDGSDILGGAVKRDDSSADALYFKFHVDPLSDFSTEEYLATFEFYEGGAERLAVGNSLKAWGYSAFNTETTGKLNTVFGDVDLRSSRPELFEPGVFLPYERVRRGTECTIVLKVQYVPGGSDQVTVWLNPDLGAGATEQSQPESITTRFTANASFSEIRLRHAGGGGGWTFSDMAIATAFGDFVLAGSVGAGENLPGGLGFTFRAWQREQGLPQTAVHALAQTRDGYLWVGSDDGVTRFDGVRFVSFGLREGLSNGPVRVLCPAADGALWIGTLRGGLTRRSLGQFTAFTRRDGLPSDSITALAEDSENQLWVGTDAGLVRMKADRIETLSAAAEFKNKVISLLYRDPHGGMWLGAAGSGIFHYTNGNFQRLVDPAIEPLVLDSHCLLEDSSGRLWLGVGDDFVLCRDGEQWRRYRIPRRLVRPFVNSLAEQFDGTVWAGSVSEGLFQFQNGKLTAVNASSGLSDNFVECLLVDQEGNLWAGTGAGLNRIRRKTLAVFAQDIGLGYGPVNGLAEVANGIVWAGKPSDGLYRWSDANFSRVSVAELSRRPAQINSLLVTRDGSCWVAGTSGLFRFKSPLAELPEADSPALPGRNVLALAEDGAGILWAGTREGEVWRLNTGRWSPQTNYALSHAVTVIVPDRDDSLWLGTEGGGLYHLKGSATVQHFDKRNGLLSDSIRCLYRDAEDRIWIGTAGGGMSCWRGGRLVGTFTTRENLPDDTISQILEDDNGRLWLGSNRGIGCASKLDLLELAAGKLPAIYPQVYGRPEGMLSEECTGGFWPAGLKSKSGRLWFPTLKGIVVTEPHPRISEAPPPPVVLEQVLVDGVPLTNVSGKWGELDIGKASLNHILTHSAASVSATPPNSGAAGITIEPGRHRLEFHYTGLSFSAPDRVRFRYQMEKLDAEWVEPGTRRVAYYGYVPPGHYRFRVTACGGDGVWNEAGTSLDVTVLRHFWQTWWFLGLLALGVLGSVGGAARISEKRKLHRRLERLEKERALERERARIAQDLHDDLGASLTRISLLSDLVKADKETPGQVEIHASKISQSAWQTVRALDEIVWALRPGSDSLRSLVEYIAHFATELFDGDHAHCRLDLPEDIPSRPLPPDMRHNAFLVIKEALTNALKHARASEVKVQAKIAGDSLELVVQDDGQGFDPALPPPPGKRHGLGNMRRRADAMGGSLAVQSRPGEGTTVRLSVRLIVNP